MRKFEKPIVKAQCGRDKDKLFIVIGYENDFALIVDGKSRKLQKPKKKNIKHLNFLNIMCELNDESFNSNNLANNKLIEGYLKKIT